MRTSRAITSLVVVGTLSGCFGGGDGGGTGGGGESDSADAAGSNARVYDPVEFRSEFLDENACVDFSPCESDYNGEWEWTGITFCEDLVDQFNPMIDVPECRDAFVGLAVDHGGTVVIEEMGSGCVGPGKVTASISVRAAIQITPACANALGLEGDFAAGCAELGQVLDDMLAGEMITGGCAVQGDICACDLTTPTMEIFREGVCNPDLPNHSCVEGNVMTVHSGLADDVDLEMVLELTRISSGSAPVSEPAPQPGPGMMQEPIDPPNPEPPTPSGCSVAADCPAGSACILACEEADGTPQTNYVGQCWPSDQLLVLGIGPCSGQLRSDPELTADMMQPPDPADPNDPVPPPPIDVNDLLSCDTTVESVTACGDTECPELSDVSALACAVNCCTSDDQCGVRNTSTLIGSPECVAPDEQCPLPPELVALGGASFVGCCLDTGMCGIGVGTTCIGYDDGPVPFPLPVEPMTCEPEPAP
jgi:hypothetical protein